MRAISRFMSGFLNFDQVALGRLVADTKNPTHKFHDPQTFELNLANFSRNEFENIYSLTESNSSFTFELALTKLLDLLIKRSGAADDGVKSKKAVRYQLLNPEDRLGEILRGDEAKKWVERVKQRSKIYLVTEIHTIQDASLALGQSKTAEVKAQANLPVSFAVEAIAPSSTTLSPGSQALASAVDPRIELNHEQNQQQRTVFNAPGERIFAVGYFEIILQKKNEESPELAKKVTWRSFDCSKGPKDSCIEVEAFVKGLDDVSEQDQVAAKICGSKSTFVIYEDLLKDNSTL